MGSGCSAASTIGLAAILLSCAAPSPLPLTAVRLPPSDAEFAESFTYISSVRELGDGQVIITDPRESRIILVDLRTGAARPVSRQGRGPDEWSNAVAFRPTRGDSSLQIDPVSRRWMVFHRDRVVEVLPADAPVIVATRGFASTVDGLGNVFAVAPPRLPPQPGATTRTAHDSVALVRYALDTGEADTVEMLRDAPATIHRALGAGGDLEDVKVTRPAFSVGEQAAAFVDGWLAVARLDPYRVDWRSPEGRVFKGGPLPVPIAVLTDREREAYVARFTKQFADPDGHMPPQMREALGRRLTEFPEAIPPFGPGALIAGGDGRLYIRRTPTVDRPEPRYDVVNRRGGLDWQVALDPGSRIVTVSERYVYVVWRDADDLERLRRHPLLTRSP